MLNCVKRDMKKPAYFFCGLLYFGSPTWTRTRDLQINRAFHTGDSIPAFSRVYGSSFY